MTESRAKPEQPEWLDSGREEAKKQADKPEHCRIVVLGIGATGNSTVNDFMQTGMQNVECVAISTADQADSVLNGADVVFIATSLDNAAETALGSVAARSAREKNAVVVGFVSAPTRIGKRRTAALNAMRQACDTVVVVDKNKLEEMTCHLPVKRGVKAADRAFASMIQGIVETISEPNSINLNFADFRGIVQRGGVAAISMGESDAPNRAEEAIRNALNSPLLDVDYSGATGALVHVVGDNHMTLEEVNHVGEVVTEIMGRQAQVVWGAKTNPTEDGFLKVTLMMTGVNSPKTHKGYGKLMPKLYDLESSFTEPEKPLHIDFGLDQLENFVE